MILALIAAAGLASATELPPLKTVAHVDLNRYAGRWYEIAKYPNRFQRGCEGAIAEYTPREDGRITVRNTCRRPDGSLKDIEGVARVVDRETNAMLKVSFVPGWLRWTGIGSGDYWVIDLDPDYRYAVVSEPDREYLWILSRTPRMSPDDYERVLARIREQGLDPARLVTSSLRR